MHKWYYSVSGIIKLMEDMQPTSPVGQGNLPAKNSTNLFLLIGFLVVLSGVIIWYLKMSFGPAPAIIPIASQGGTNNSQTAAGLGATIYQNSNNPIQDKLPTSSNPVDAANPVQDLYQNPFK